VAATAEAATGTGGAFALNATHAVDLGLRGLVQHQLVWAWSDPESCPQVLRDLIDVVRANGRRHQQDDANRIGGELLGMSQFGVVTGLAQPRPRQLKRSLAVEPGQPAGISREPEAQTCHFHLIRAPGCRRHQRRRR
jgi:hypothetical protein